MEIVEESGRYNEIEQFQDARYVSASESAWRILAFDIVENDPSVCRLEMHTEGHHTVYVQEGEDASGLEGASYEIDGVVQSQYHLSWC